VDDDGDIVEEEDDDHLMVPSQCEVCHFQNIMAPDPGLTLATDREILDMVRRANFDAFWSRESLTVT
jgi:hypothetical protein